MSRAPAAQPRLHANKPMSYKHYNKSAALVTTLATLAVAGCGIAHPFQPQANKICRQYTAKVYTLPAPLTRTQTRAHAGQTLQLLATANQQLSKLRPPAHETTAYQLLLADMQRAIATATQIHNATGANHKANRVATRALSRELTVALAQLKHDARPVNLTSCT
jgi:hypothetical protein